MNSLWMLELQELSDTERFDIEQLKKKHALFITNRAGHCQIQGPQEILGHLIERLGLASKVLSLRTLDSELPLSTRGKRSSLSSENKFWLMAGPCSAESYEQLEICLKALKEHGINWVRAGIFKPRSSPYAFQGHGNLAIDWLRELKQTYEVQLVSEIIDPRDIDSALSVVDMIQIGARNMHNTALLKAVAEVGRPILLKRGWSATYKEWLSSAEYLLYHGAKDVLLCERGIRSFETHTRFTLDINAVAVMKELTHLPILVDPSHATGQRRWVLAAARAAVAAGADGLLIEVHPNPDQALSDGAQSLPLEALDDITRLVRMRQWLVDQQMI